MVKRYIQMLIRKITLLCFCLKVVIAKCVLEFVAFCYLSSL